MRLENIGGVGIFEAAEGDRPATEVHQEGKN
jgi:hypothetical protein